MIKKINNKKLNKRRFKIKMLHRMLEKPSLMKLHLNKRMERVKINSKINRATY